MKPIMDTAELNAALKEIAKGKRDAFRLIVKAYGLPLRSYLAAQLYHVDVVDDLAQEVFIAAYRNLKSFRRGEDFAAWLRGIARNKLYNYYRSTSRRGNAMEKFRVEVVEVVEGDLEHSVSDDRRESVEALLRCIGKLPERMRHVVHAGLNGEKPATLADEMETSVGAIYNLHYRANQLLRECVTKELAHE